MISLAVAGMLLIAVGAQYWAVIGPMGRWVSALFGFIVGVLTSPIGHLLAWLRARRRL